MSHSSLYHYQAYGLRIQSELTLPELVAIAAPDPHPEPQPDVVIALQSLPESPLRGNSAPHSYQLTPEGLYLYWRSVGMFRVNSHTIWVDPDPNADEAGLRLFILGAAFGGVLHQRNLFVLHACAASIEGKALVAMGNKGWGKSTLLATLANRGHGVLSDDVVAVDLSNPQQPLVLPACPQIKLWPDAVDVVCDRPGLATPVTPSSQKKQLLWRDRFQNQAIPLAHVLVLGEGEAIQITALSTQEAIRSLLAHTYVTRFQDELLRGDVATHHLGQLTQLINSTPVYRLMRPANLALLDAVAIALEAHIRNA
jgi:hypothetical protein